MFTGIISEVASCQKIGRLSGRRRLTLHREKVRPLLRVGDSVAVNGCCLTVVTIQRDSSGQSLTFDLSDETWRRTAFHRTAPGAAVNLEHCLAATGRLGGHFVLGHIDGTGVVTEWRENNQDRILAISAPTAIMRYVVSKGSIAVDGISLTISRVRKNKFEAAIIPHTLTQTSLRERKRGDLVNLEADILGKYIEALLPKR